MTIIIAVAMAAAGLTAILLACVQNSKFDTEREKATKVLMSVLAQHAEAARTWAEERRELCNRIQRPEHVPYVPVEGYEIPEREPDGWNKVGTVEITREWLEGDD